MPLVGKEGFKGKGGEREKERRGSYGNVEEMLARMKRKREEGSKGEEEEAKREEGIIFGISKKMQRSPGGWRRSEMEKGSEEVMGKGGEEEEKEEREKGVWEELKFLKERLRKQEREMEWMKREMERLTRREEEWMKEKREWKEKMEARGSREKEIVEEDEGEGKKRGWEIVEIEKKVRGIERMMERREKEDRGRSVVMRGVKQWKGDLRWGVEQVLKEIGAVVRLQEVRKVKSAREEGGDVVVIKLGNEEERKEVLRKKRGLIGRRIWIEEDLSWEERRVRWRLREIAKEEEEKGRKAWVTQERIRIDGEWWWWDKEREVLLDRRGKMRGERRGRDGGNQKQGEGIEGMVWERGE